MPRFCTRSVVVTGVRRTRPSRRLSDHGLRRRDRRPAHPLRRPGAARRRLLPGRRRRPRRAGRRERRRQDDAAADRRRRPDARSGLGRPQRRARRHAAVHRLGRDDTTVQRFLVGLAPPASARRGTRWRPPSSRSWRPTTSRPSWPTPARSPSGATPAATTPRSPGTRSPSRPSARPTTAASTASSPRSRAGSRSGWRWRRCCAGPTRCCCSTSRTTTSTSPASAGWRSGCSRRPKTVLFVSHDRELLARVADRVVTVEGGTAWVHGGGFTSYPEARADRTSGWPRCAAAGTRSTPGSSWCAPCSSRRRSPGHGLAVPRHADPAGEVRGGRPAAGPPAGAEGGHAAARRPTGVRAVVASSWS